MTSTRYAQRNDTTSNYTPLLPKGVQRLRVNANAPCSGSTGPEETPVGRQHHADATRAQGYNRQAQGMRLAVQRVDRSEGDSGGPSTPSNLKSEQPCRRRRGPK